MKRERHTKESSPDGGMKVERSPDSKVMRGGYANRHATHIKSASGALYKPCGGGTQRHSLLSTHIHGECLFDSEGSDGDEGEDHNEDGGGFNDTEGCEVVGEALASFALSIGGAAAGATLEDGGHADAGTGEDAEDEHAEAAAGHDFGGDHGEHEDHSVQGLGDGGADVGEEEEGCGAVLRIALFPGADGAGGGEAGADGGAEAGEGEAGNGACNGECGIHSVCSFIAENCF